MEEREHKLCKRRHQCWNQRTTVEGERHVQKSLLAVNQLNAGATHTFWNYKKAFSNFRFPVLDLFQGVSKRKSSRSIEETFL